MNRLPRKIKATVKRRPLRVALEHRKTLRGYTFLLEAVWQFKERQCNSNKNAKTREKD